MKCNRLTFLSIGHKYMQLEIPDKEKLVFEPFPLLLASLYFPVRF